jgi:hypothetical protein
VSQGVEESRKIPFLRNVVFRLDTDQLSQRLVAAQFAQATFDGGVAQGNAENQHAPQGTDRIITASLAARHLHRIHELLIGSLLTRSRSSPGARLLACETHVSQLSAGAVAFAGIYGQLNLPRFPSTFSFLKGVL